MDNKYIVPYDNYYIHMLWENNIDIIYAVTITLRVYNSDDISILIDKNLIMYGNDISHQQSINLVRIMDKCDDDIFKFSRYIKKFLIEIGVGGQNSLNSCIESYERSKKITEFYNDNK